MNRWLWAGVALLLACASPALAQFWPVAPLGQAGHGASSYVGPGDVVSGAAAWYGLRGYNAAYSTGSNPAVNIRRASDGHTCDLLVTSAGAIGNTANCSTGGDNGQSAASFAGTAATCTGTISGTTMSISSCASGTLGQNEQVTGSGIVGPTYITSIGTCASPPGTCALQVSQTVGSPVTITASVGLSVTKFYDQSGANLCSSAPCNIIQTIVVNQPIFLSSCVGTAPCLGFLSAAPDSLVSPVTSPLSTSSVITMSIVAQNQNNVATYGSILGVYSGEIGVFGSAANTVTVYAGNTVRQQRRPLILRRTHYSTFSTGQPLILTLTALRVPPGMPEHSRSAPRLIWGPRIMLISPAC